MIEYKITVDAADALRILDAIDDPALRADIAQAVADDVVLPKLRDYPPQTHAKQPFSSDASRRYFFAALKAGAIEVPYRRSNALGSDWTQQPTGDGITLVSGQDYSDLVLTKGLQSKYHQGNWPTTDTVAEQSESEAERVAEETIVKKIGDAA